jgi:hypothetical protein
MRLLFDATLPHVSGFPKPNISVVVDGRNKLEVTAYDIAGVTYEYVALGLRARVLVGPAYASFCRA